MRRYWEGNPPGLRTEKRAVGFRTEEGGGVSDRRGRWGFGHLRGEVEVVGSEEVSELDAVDGAGAIPDGHTNPR